MGEAGEIEEGAVGAIEMLAAPAGAGVTETEIGVEAVRGPVDEIFPEIDGEAAVLAVGAGVVGAGAATGEAVADLDTEIKTREEGGDSAEEARAERMLRSRSSSKRAETPQVIMTDFTHPAIGSLIAPIAGINFDHYDDIPVEVRSSSQQQRGDADVAPPFPNPRGVGSRFGSKRLPFTRRPPPPPPPILLSAPIAPSPIGPARPARAGPPELRGAAAQERDGGAEHRVVQGRPQLGGARHGQHRSRLLRQAHPRPEARPPHRCPPPQSAAPRATAAPRRAAPRRIPLSWTQPPSSFTAAPLLVAALLQPSCVLVASLLRPCCVLVAALLQPCCILVASLLRPRCIAVASGCGPQLPRCTLVAACASAVAPAAAGRPRRRRPTAAAPRFIRHGPATVTPSRRGSKA